VVLAALPSAYAGGGTAAAAELAAERVLLPPAAVRKASSAAALTTSPSVCPFLCGARSFTVLWTGVASSREGASPLRFLHAPLQPPSLPWSAVCPPPSPLPFCLLRGCKQHPHSFKRTRT